MPIYEYRCEHGHTFEVMQRMSDDPVASCETCSSPVERVFHPIAVHFKGSGFYNTDYGTRKRSRERNESSEGSDKSNKDGSSKSESTSSSKSESPSSTETKSAKSPSPASASSN
jgi:putative FmdB family regulatory protein